MIWKFESIVSKGLKLKVRKVWGLISVFNEVEGEKMVGENFYSPLSPEN